MIPTRFRSKLPKNLTYPIGAEAITAGLAGAPHLDAVQLKFYERPIEPASRFRQALKEQLPYPIVVAEYHPARTPGLSAAGFMIEAGWYNERWELTVYPVLREFRHVAIRLLLEWGFPALSRWMREAEPGSRGITTQRADLVFNPAEGSLTISERTEHESSRV
jgi:hypothetical protein